MRNPHDIIGSYVTDALDSGDVMEFAEHRAECEDCSNEAAEFAETLTELTHVTAVVPPTELRGALLAAARQRPQLPPEPIRLRSPAQKATGRRGRVSLLLAAAAAALVVALGGWLHSSTQVQSYQVAASEEVSLLSASDVVVRRSTVSGAPVSYIVSEQRQRALVVGEGLAAPGPGRSYQLWRLTSAGAQPDALIPVGGTFRTWVSGSLNDVTGLALTLEPAGGSARPTTEPLSLVKL